MSDFWMFWSAYWWLVFPLFGMAYGAFGMWLNYRRAYQAMEVLKAFAANGREPPAEIVATLRNTAAPDCTRGLSAPPSGASPSAAWTIAIPFGAISAGFTVAAALTPLNVRPVFIVLAVTFVALALGFSLLALMQGRRDRG